MNATPGNAEAVCGLANEVQAEAYLIGRAAERAAEEGTPAGPLVNALIRLRAVKEELAAVVLACEPEAAARPPEPAQAGLPLVLPCLLEIEELPDPNGVPGTVRLRVALKVMLRSFRLRCRSVRAADRPAPGEGPR
jgi:hypothetical protein